MYFQYHDATYCLNIDWLQYSVHLITTEPEIICPDGMRIEICQGNNIFEYRALVYDARGAKYMTLLWKPYSSVLPSNLMTVQVANEFLYLNGQGVLWSFQDLQKIVDCTFNAIGRVDICVDWQSTPTRVEFLKHLNSAHYYVQGKREGSTWWHEVSSKSHYHKQLHALTWGSQTSEIKVKTYHKSREQGLVDNPNGQPDKPWIVNEWKVAGMDVTDVWRLEFSLSGAGQLRYKGKPISLENVSDNQWIVDVFFELYHHRFVTRINQGRRNGHHNDDARVYLLDLPLRSRQLKWAEAKGDDYELPAAIELLRSMMRQIDNPIVMASKVTFEDYANTIANIVNDYRLDGYFLRTWRQDCQSYLNEMYTNVGGGLKTIAANPRKLMQ